MSKIYFLSDCHLGASTFKDPLEYERRVVRFLTSIEDDCEELYLMGDIIDYWFEFKYVVPRGFTRFLGQLGRMSDRGIRIHWFTGNHDIWIFDYLPHEVGCTLHRHQEVINLRGKRLLLAHGDGLGDDSQSFKLMTRFFHNSVCQKMFRWIHPDFTTAFAHAWSRHSRLTGDDFPDFMGEDKEHLVKFAKTYINAHSAEECPNYFIFGHRHIELDLMLSRQSRLFILGDWITHFSYAVMDEKGNMWMDNFELPEVEEEERVGVSIAF